MRVTWDSHPFWPIKPAGKNDELEQSTTQDLVLVVDDDLDWLAEASFMLKTMGLQAITACCAEEALAQAANPEISIVIVDYSMPSCDGVALIEQLSAIAAEEGRQMHVIMVTGHATLDVAVGAMRASAADFLQKPVTQDSLKKALQRANGLVERPAARSDLIGKISSLSTELYRLSMLISNGGDAPAESSLGHPAPASDAASVEDKASYADKAEVSADFIRTLLRNEAKRRKLGGGMLFGDPAWDLLLDLLLAKLERRVVSVSSACIASGAPTSTALRLINRLIDENVLYRVQDERDGRRNFLRIHADIEKALFDYLAERTHFH